jgi:hypothetical protein
MQQGARSVSDHSQMLAGDCSVLESGLGPGLDRLSCALHHLYLFQLALMSDSMWGATEMLQTKDQLYPHVYVCLCSRSKLILVCYAVFVQIALVVGAAASSLAQNLYSLPKISTEQK